MSQASGWLCYICSITTSLSFQRPKQPRVGEKQHEQERRQVGATGASKQWAGPVSARVLSQQCVRVPACPGPVTRPRCWGLTRPHPPQHLALESGLAPSVLYNMTESFRSPSSHNPIPCVSVPTQTHANSVMLFHQGKRK